MRDSCRLTSSSIPSTWRFFAIATAVSFAPRGAAELVARAGPAMPSSSRGGPGSPSLAWLARGPGSGSAPRCALERLPDEALAHVLDEALLEGRRGVRAPPRARRVVHARDAWAALAGKSAALASRGTRGWDRRARRRPRVGEGLQRATRRRRGRRRRRRHAAALPAPPPEAPRVPPRARRGRSPRPLRPIPSRRVRGADAAASARPSSSARPRPGPAPPPPPPRPRPTNLAREAMAASSTDRPEGRECANVLARRVRPLYDSRAFRIRPSSYWSSAGSVASDAVDRVVLGRLVTPVAIVRAVRVRVPRPRRPLHHLGRLRAGENQVPRRIATRKRDEKPVRVPVRERSTSRRAGSAPVRARRGAGTSARARTRAEKTAAATISASTSGRPKRRSTPDVERGEPGRAARPRPRRRAVRVPRARPVRRRDAPDRAHRAADATARRRAVVRGSRPRRRRGRARGRLSPPSPRTAKTTAAASCLRALDELMDGYNAWPFADDRSPGALDTRRADRETRAPRRPSRGGIQTRAGSAPRERRATKRKTSRRRRRRRRRRERKERKTRERRHARARTVGWIFVDSDEEDECGCVGDTNSMDYF